MSHCLWEDILLVWLIAGIICMACIVVMNDALTPSEAVACVSALIMGPVAPIVFGVMAAFQKAQQANKDRAARLKDKTGMRGSVARSAQLSRKKPISKGKIFRRK